MTEDKGRALRNGATITFSFLSYQLSGATRVSAVCFSCLSLFSCIISAVATRVPEVCFSCHLFFNNCRAQRVCPKSVFLAIFFLINCHAQRVCPKSVFRPNHLFLLELSTVGCDACVRSLFPVPSFDSVERNACVRSLFSVPSFDYCINST